MKLFRTIRLSNGRGTAKVDSKEYGRVSRFSWSLTCGKYASSLIRRKRVYMHRMILGVVDPEIKVDHRNGDPLDNRRSNLRVATSSQNQANRFRCTSASGFKGVSRTRNTTVNPWTATITSSGVRYDLGYFASAEAAAWAYDNAALRLFGEFARINKVRKPAVLRNPPRYSHLKKRSNATSKYFGVSFRQDQPNNPWAVHLSVCNKPRYIGSFSTEAEAALAYNTASKQQFGKLGKLNTVISR